MDEHEQQKKRTSRKVGRILFIVFLVLVCLLCVLLLTGALIFHHYYSLIEYEEADSSVPSLTSEEISRILDDLYGDESVLSESEMEETGREALDTSIDEYIENNRGEESDTEQEEDAWLSNILVIGMDVSDSGSRSRSDTMIVATVNEKTGRIVLTSLLRDIYLSIPEYPNNRLNASFSLGGVALLQKTIYENFGIEIDRYIAIDFSAFESIIDMLGGIELTLTDQDCIHVFPDEGKTAGVYTLNGSQALMYARWRKGASDFERTERQRTVMTTVIGRLLDMSLSELTDVMGEILPKVRTDLTELDCYAILFKVGRLAGYEISTDRIPYAGTWEYATIDGKSVLTLDLAENRRLFFEKALADE